MNQKTIDILELGKIKKMLLEHVVSPLGAAEAEQAPVSTRIDEIRTMQAETSEAAWYLLREGTSPVLPFTDARAALKRSEKESVLNHAELLSVAACLRSGRNAKAAIGAFTGQYPRLEALAGELYPNKKAEGEIYRCILSEDEMADDASSELSTIRKRIRVLGERMRQKLQSMIHSPEYKKYLQDPIITIRNGRYVLPVKQEYRGQVPGILHDQSSSGATAFIEPMAAMESNNEIKKLELEERAEMDRVLARLTKMAAGFAGALTVSIEALGKLDFIFAKGALSRKLRASEPQVNEDGIIEFYEGRHPLIPEDSVVPIGLKLGGDVKGLIITGPNTGGKTVTLKTVGLFVLMAQSGLHIPAAEGAKTGFFENVFADIGDEQSIEQSLSTFSSHMTNVVNILRSANSHSLILLDEMGAGTDPAEGAALAMALLDELRNRGATILATTHYGQLKAFAMNKPGLGNASMEFDVKTLQPTFRLLMGIPGRSNAFEISRRLGLEPGIVENAKGYLEGGKVSFEELISKAETHRQAALEERRKAESARHEADKLRAAMESIAKQQEEKAKRAVEKAKEEARGILTSARDQAEEAIDAIKKAAREEEAKRTLTMHEGRKSIENAINDLAATAVETGEGERVPPEEIKKAMTVYLPRYNQTASVLSPPDEKGEVSLLAGVLRLSLPQEEICRAVITDKKPSPARNKVVLQPKQAATELHLRHMTLDEAIPELDKYLDDAFLCGLPSVRIVHGKGTGTLRSAVHKHLKTHPHVKSFRAGKYGEGETGVTIVELK
ncbi:MAG: endonuclease MutS2 [Bacillota bacterium]|nr:endonuclease MutS2 [Bacillota bacterium]